MVCSYSSRDLHFSTQLYYISSYIFVCMARVNPNIIDREEAFQSYYAMGPNRSIERLIDVLVISHPGLVPALNTLKTWSTQGDWIYRIEKLEEGIRDGVNEAMINEGVIIKTKLLKTLLDQIDHAIEDGVRPSSTRELVAVVHEVRGIIGDSDKIDISGSVDVVSIYIPDNKRDDI